MTKYFDTLSDEEKQTLQNAFVSITLLIASADSKLTEEEKAEAINTIKVRGYEANHLFHEFYDEMGRDFAQKLENAASTHVVSRDNEDIFAREISQVNPVLDKLPNSISKRIYKDYLSFAHRIANASGGILGYATISREERNLLGLPMIHPIIDEEEEE